MSERRTVERGIVRKLQELLPHPDFSGEIELRMGEDSTGVSGRLVDTRTGETTQYTTLYAKDPEGFRYLFDALRNASLREPRGAVYAVEIRCRDRRIFFTYWRERDAMSNLSQVKRDDFGSMPSFVYSGGLTEAVCRHLRSEDVCSALMFGVANGVRAGRRVPDHAFAAFAVYDWLSDTRNGALDQYFAQPLRGPRPDTPLSHVYEAVREGCRLAGVSQAVSLFEEGVQLWSHFHEHVNVARTQMGLPEVPKQTTSDIDSRFYEIDDHVDHAIESWVSEDPLRLVRFP